MSGLAEFLAMGGYGLFVWSSYLVTALVIGGLFVWSYRGLRAAEKRERALGGRERRRARRGEAR